MKTEAIEFLFASLVTSYPDDSFPEYVAQLLDDPSLEIPLSLRAQVEATLLSEHTLDDLRSLYIDLFDRGRSSNPLYETEYGRARAMVKGHELADISGFYLAFGLEFPPDATNKDMVDHIAIELEFYALLLLKHQALAENNNQEGTEVVHDARVKFMQDHLGRFAAAIMKRPGVAGNRFYSTVFGWCNELIQAECLEIGAQVIAAEWVAGEQEEEEVCCKLGGSTAAEKALSASL